MGKMIGTATTDEDGFYFIYYRHKGKQAIFKVQVYNGDDILEEQEVELKANKFVEVNFVI